MQNHELVSFEMLCHPYDTPTFKTKALHLVTNGGQLKCFLLICIYMGNTALP